MKSMIYKLFLLLFLVLISQAENDAESGSGNSDDSGSGSGSGADIDSVVKRSGLKVNKNVEFPDIINISVKAIISPETTEEQLREILVKFYFTDKKELSIWPKAIEESEKTIGAEFEERELFEMENDVKNLYRRMLECELNSKKKKNKNLKDLKKITARCFLTLREYIDDGQVDFSLPRGSMKGQAKMLEMHIAYEIMSLVILKLAEKKAQNAEVSFFKAANYTIKIASTLVEECTIATRNSIASRLELISQTEICLMQECLWQEFETTCESRSRRSVPNSDTGIGGEGNIFVEKYRAKVVDSVTKEEICNMAMSTNTTAGAYAIKAQLAKQCAIKKNIYSKNVKKDIERFYSSRTLPLVQNLCRLWGCDKKKLKKIKINFAM